MNPVITYGINPVITALNAGTKFQSIMLAVGLARTMRKEIEGLARRLDVPVFTADRKELNKMTRGGVHQGVVAIAGKLPSVSLEELATMEAKPRTVLLCLDSIQDPRNVGALARTGLALGAVGMVIPTQRAAGITPAAIKASAGALSILPVARVNNLARSLDRLKENKFWIAGAVMVGGQSPWELDSLEKIALVLGAEGKGIRKGVESRLDYRVQIPTKPPMQSLNVSVAGAILMYEMLRRPR